jgi:hypothetical protein
MAVVNAVAYIVPASTAGNQAWTGSLGMDFDVVNTITITELGVFDDNSDGLSAPITVTLFERASQLPVPGGSLTFAAGPTGTLIGGSRFLPIAPLILAGGTIYTIVASGYGATELNGNSFGGVPVWTTDGSGDLAFVGSARFDATPNIFPPATDSGPANRYAAGTFIFTSGAVPVELSQFSID